MKTFILFAFFICSNFIMAQGANIVPPDTVISAFAKQYPKKKANWDVEYSGTNDDITFEARFTKAPKILAFAQYDENGIFKACKVQMPQVKLSKKIKGFLKANYSAKSVKQSFSVIDNKEKRTYEVGVIKDSKFYTLVFDHEGEIYKRIQTR